MKNLALLLLALPTAILAAPTDDNALLTRQSNAAVTDELLWRVSLPVFEDHRNWRSPPSQDWSSSDCGRMPSNPFKFPFQPACHRRDFGYRNYKAQFRFSEKAKSDIDIKFRNESVFSVMAPSCNTESVPPLTP